MNRPFVHSVLVLIILMQIAPAAGDSNLVVSIQDNYREVLAGNDVWFTIKIANLANAEKSDVTLDYWVSNSDNVTLVENRETTAVQTQASFVRVFNILESTVPGKYRLNVRMDYGDGMESLAYESFNVAENKADNSAYYIISLIALIAIISVVLILSYKQLWIMLEKFLIKLRVSNIVRRRKL